MTTQRSRYSVGFIITAVACGAGLISAVVLMWVGVKGYFSHPSTYYACSPAGPPMPCFSNTDIYVGVALLGFVLAGLALLVLYIAIARRASRGVAVEH